MDHRARIVAAAAIALGALAPSATTVDADVGGASPGTPRGAASVLAAGARHTCVIDGGDVVCWGDDGSGQVGNGTTTGDVAAPPTPIDLPTGRTATSIVGGADHTCAILDTGDITCWGSDGSGQLGNGAATGDVTAPPTPIDLPAGRTATAITAGTDHTCAILDNREVTCWGNDGSGQVGNGTTTGDVAAPPAPIDLPTGRTATAITAGTNHTCAILDTGDITCWGSDIEGQVGNGSVGGDVTAPPDAVDLPAGRTAAAVAGGNEHTCAVLDDGNVTCWGNDSLGQLGNGPPTGTILAPPPAITLPPGRLAIAITAGENHTCALLDNSHITCWGWDGSGQLGNGATTGAVTEPPDTVFLPAGRTAVAVVAGSAHTCALLDNDEVTCWGSDSHGQLGNGATGAVDSPPAPVAGPSGPLTAPPVAAAPSPPGAPSPVAGAESADVSWTAPTDAGGSAITGYRIEGSVDGGATWATLIADTGSAAASATVGGLTAQVAIRFRVVALNAAGASPPSSPSTDVTPFTTPDPPTSVEAVAADASAELSWTAPGDDGGAPLAGYRIQSSVDGGASWSTVVADTGSTATARLVTGLVNGQAVRFRIAAINAAGRGDDSLPSAAVTPVLPPGWNTIEPARLLETRVGPTETTIDGQFQGTGPVPAGTHIEVQIAGRADIPTTATSAILNVTITQPQAPGFATIYPCTTTPPNASNLNYSPNQTIPNAAIAKLSPTGTICIYTLATTHIIIDANGHA